MDVCVRRSVPITRHLAGVLMSSLDRQSLCREPGCFARMRAMWRCGGVHWTYLLSLHCRAPVVQTLVKAYRICMLGGKFFDLEIKSFFGNVVLLKKIVGVFMRVLIRTTRQKAFHEGEKFSSSWLIVFIKHLLKVKKTTSSLEIRRKVGECCALILWSGVPSG